MFVEALPSNLWRFSNELNPSLMTLLPPPLPLTSYYSNIVLLDEPSELLAYVSLFAVVSFEVVPLLV